MKKEEFKKWIILIVLAISIYWLFNNIGFIFGIIGKIIDVLSPFIIGIGLAYVLNIPMVKIEKFLKNKFGEELPVRVISIAISLVLVISIFAFVLLLLIPELIGNIELLIDNIPILISKIEDFVVGLLDKYPDIQWEIEKMFNENSSNNDILVNILNYILNGSINIISSIVSSVITIFTAFIFAIYMLSQKEMLQTSLKKLVYVYFNKNNANKVMEIASLSNTTFTKFISGQCLEASILGLIFFVVMSIFRFPYALIISLLTGVTAIIPIFGALISILIGAILIAITNPFQAFIFILVFLVIQQIEENFIYPKVVGKSVGLSPLWTLLVITVGGGLFGILGMLLGLPIASILYSLFNDRTSNKINN